MSKKIPPVLSKQVAFNGLIYILKGGLINATGHLPKHDHTVPDDFFGVCVASNQNPDVDSYIIKELKTLGVKNVNLDFSYADLGNFNERFLQALLEQKFNVTLRLIPPYDAAKRLFETPHQEDWRSFLSTLLDRYGEQFTQIEVGNTVNRKLWSGYNLNSFLVAWRIAYKEIKAHGLKLIGPNVQDFEPVYNIGLLKLLKAKNQLPDIHSNNLFVERVSEPERFDHRILKYQWAKRLKYNLIKKANIINSIARHFGVDETISSAAFWAIYRIKRRLLNGREKQADYLTRYFTLLAASGTLKQANWGALICHREGLITDGLSDADYPEMERIGHYRNADGELKNYTRHPSFYAMQTVVKHLSGAYYARAIATAKGLEIHHFEKDQQIIHVAWTINGKAAILSDIYSEASLAKASILHRDGNLLETNLGFITETPIYLIWNKKANIKTKPTPALSSHLTIYKHIGGLQYFHFCQHGWRGLVLAKDVDEMHLLLESIHPEHLHSPNKEDALRHARNAIWAINDPRAPGKQLTVKQPVKMYPHKAFLDRFKPSKAKRSWNGAMALLRHGIDSAKPVAFFEKIGDKSLKQNFYICEYQTSNCTIGEIFSTFRRGEREYKHITPDEIYPQFAQFCNLMHHRGIHFRDFSGGNILINIQDDHSLNFSLIDTARLHTYDYSMPFKLRMADLTRACNKLHWQGREQFMRQYLALTGRKFTLRYKLPFYLYDFKVKLKRTIGRKGIKKLIKRFKGNG